MEAVRTLDVNEKAKMLKAFHKELKKHEYWYHSMFGERLNETFGNVLFRRGGEIIWKASFFNAYYDDVPGLDEYLDISVSISTDTGEPRVKLTLKAIAAADRESLRLAKSTIKELHLVRTYWQPMANREMRTLIRQLTSAYKTAFNKRNVS